MTDGPILLWGEVDTDLPREHYERLAFLAVGTKHELWYQERALLHKIACKLERRRRRARFWRRLGDSAPYLLLYAAIIGWILVVGWFIIGCLLFHDHI